MGHSRSATGEQIERSSPRALFAKLVAQAVDRVRVQPTPMATAYLIELLDGRVRERGGDPGTLAEALLTARTEGGAERIRRMRELGDRALFTAGYFPDSVSGPRSVVDLGYYRQIGSDAYRDVAGALSRRGETWRRLYSELAQRFADFADVLAEVGDRSRAGQPDQLVQLYERYWRTGSPRDRVRLMRLGHLPAEPGSRRPEWQ